MRLPIRLLAYIGFAFCAQAAVHGQESAGCDTHICFGINWENPRIQDVINLDLSLYENTPITPFHYAVRNCASPSVLLLLAEKGADVNRVDRSIGLSTLQAAVSICPSEVIQTLIELGADTTVKDVNGGNVLHTAIRLKRSDKTVRTLFASNVDINEHDDKKDTPLILLLGQGKVELVLEMLDYGANPNVVDANNATPAHYAAHTGNLELLQKLLQRGADFSLTNNVGQTPLHFAASRGLTPEVAAVFVLAEADPNATDDQGLTPLHYAAAGKSGEEVATLLVIKANPNHYDLVGDTPLHYALSYNKDPQAVLALLRLGADPNLPNGNGDLPLFILASSEINREKFDMLLGFGADLERTDLNGDSLLHLAMYSGNAALAADLLDLGADPNRKDTRGLSALDIYEEQGIAEPANSRFAILLYNQQVRLQEASERTRQRREANQLRREQRQLEREAEKQQVQEELSVIDELEELFVDDSDDEPEQANNEPNDGDDLLENLNISENTIRELLQLIQKSAQERNTQ